jgi:hypothetical protein
MKVVMRRIRTIKLVWNSDPPTKFVRGEIVRAPRPERRSSHPRVEG